MLRHLILAVLLLVSVCVVVSPMLPDTSFDPRLPPRAYACRECSRILTTDSLQDPFCWRCFRWTSKEDRHNPGAVEAISEAIKRESQH